MKIKRQGHTRPGHCGGARGFTLVELAVVVGVIALLASLLLPALARGKAEAQATVCLNRLRQIGLAMAMLLSDSGRYPSLVDEETSELWADKLYPNNPLSWTNAAWHCPTYLARKGTVMVSPDGEAVCTSYSYNWRGTVGWRGCPPSMYQLHLGLGHLTKDAAPEPEVSVPSEMYIVADARPVADLNEIRGNPKMQPYSFSSSVEALPPHRQGYNILFGDGHVALVKRSDYLFPPRTARNWNRDNQPHPETWAPINQWAVQE